MPDRELVTILVLFCNKVEVSRRCLPSLLDTLWRPLKFILVDNGSSDDTPALLDEFEKAAAADGDVLVKSLRFEENIGAVAGRNAAFPYFEGRCTAFLDNDVRLRRRDWLDRLMSCMEAEPKAGLVAGKLLYPFPPYLIQSAGCEVSPGGRVNFRGRGLPYDTPEYDSRRKTQAAISACWLVRNDVVKEVGELDMLFHPVQFEDIDYCYRIRQAGFECWYEPEAEMYHYENTTTEGEVAPKRYLRLTLEQGLKFKRKWRHVTATDGGPDEREMVWRKVPRIPLSEIRTPPVFG